MHDKRFHASQAHRLDDPARLLWLPPDEVIAALGIEPGEIVADIGAGTGYFTLPLAWAVGSQGRVWAIDAQRKMLDILQKKLVDSAMPQVFPMLAEAERTELPNAACTCVFLANVWHEFDDRLDVLRECRRILSPNGRIAILDWRPEVERIAGPPLEHRLAPSEAMDELRQVGFTELASSSIGKYSWLVTGLKPL
jgi:ubiquinone/menaquinone biosynthesis C-methylase UbiE